MSTYRAVTLGDEDVEWIDPVFGDLREIVWSNERYADWIVELGIPLAAEMMFRYHRMIANQLIAKACKDRHESSWAWRTIGLCQRAKRLRKSLLDEYAHEFGWTARTALVDRLNSLYPRAEWGVAA